MCAGLRRRLVINIWLVFEVPVEKMNSYRSDAFTQWRATQTQECTVRLDTIATVWAYLKLHSTGADLLLQFGALSWLLISVCIYPFIQSFACFGSGNLQFLLLNITSYFCYFKVMLEVILFPKVGTFGVLIYGSYKHQLHISYLQTEIGCF